MHIVFLFLTMHFWVDVHTSLANVHDGELPDSGAQKGIRIYDCGVDSLFLVCRISGVDVSYKKCLELLPLTQKGIRMLEMKRFLEFLGLNVSPLRIR
jgi:hypothetical protein